MRRTINISVPEEMHAYLRQERGHLSVSEFIRSLIHREQQRRADHAARPQVSPLRANDCIIIHQALEHVEKLRAILVDKDRYEG